MLSFLCSLRIISFAIFLTLLLTNVHAQVPLSCSKLEVCTSWQQRCCGSTQDGSGSTSSSSCSSSLWQFSNVVPDLDFSIFFNGGVGGGYFLLGSRGVCINKNVHVESAELVAAYQFSLMESIGWRCLLGDYRFVRSRQINGLIEK